MVSVLRADRWVVAGFAVTTHFIPSDGMIITEEALRPSVQDVLKRSTVLFNHNPNKPIGKVIHADVVSTDGEYGLFVRVEISKTAPEIWEQIREGVVNKFSIRAAVLESVDEFDPEIGQTVTFVKRLEIKEISLVSVPADPMAKVTMVTIAREFKMAEKTMERNEGKQETQPENKQVERQEELELLKEIRKMLLGLITALQEGKYPLPTRQLEAEKDILQIIEDALKTAGIALSKEVWDKIVEAAEKELKYSARQLNSKDILQIIEDALKTAGIALSQEVWNKIEAAVFKAEKDYKIEPTRHYPYPYPVPKGFENIKKMLEEIKQILVGFIEAMKAGKYPLPARKEELLNEIIKRIEKVEQQPVVRKEAVKKQITQGYDQLNTDEKLKVIAAAFGVKNFGWGS